MLLKKLLPVLLLTLVTVTLSPLAFSENANSDDTAEIDITRQFIQLFFVPKNIRHLRLKNIEENWKPAYIPMAIEMMSLSRRDLAEPLAKILTARTGQNFGVDINQWFTWWWQQKIANVENYAEFKSELYGLIDDKFSGYFSNEYNSRVRLDEVRWGGVKQDGIPPLREPEMISASEATYLQDDNIVFGIKIGDDVRAYPKRILAWHEMFIAKIAGIDFAGVYCTLCGAVILYKTEYDGVKHDLGTSGFLYRSNKLMYDQKTQSLWNTTWGAPVIGPLADKKIKLERSYLVTTTWGEWTRKHPDTTVLSLNTGYQRDYAEGVAYRDYFASDELMFSISTSDSRLKNKDEILALTFPAITDRTMAISEKFLRDKPIYTARLGELQFVVLTDRSGANRVYETKGLNFTNYDSDRQLIDGKGRIWQVTEAKLSFSGEVLKRLPAHRAFWFGWHSAYPDTELVH